MLTQFPQCGRVYLIKYQLRGLDKEFDKMSTAFYNKDAQQIIESTYPLIVASIGGRSKYEDYLNDYFEDLADKSLTMSNSQIDTFILQVHSGMETQVLFLENTSFIAQDSLFQKKSYMMAIKHLFGDWKFLNVHRLNYQDMQRFLPDLSHEFEPVFERLMEVN